MKHRRDREDSAELTSQQDGVRKIVHYDEFRTEEVTSAAGCGAGGSATIGVRVEFYPHPKPASRGVVRRYKGPRQKYRRPQNRGLSFL